MHYVTKKFLLLLLLLLVSCSGNKEAGRPAATTIMPTIESTGNTGSNSVENTTGEKTTFVNEDDTIILRMIAYDWELGSYRDLIETFEIENPGIEIKMVSLEETLGLGSSEVAMWPEDASELLVSAADIVPAQAISFSGSSPKLLLNLHPLMEADPTFDRNNFYPNALEYFESTGNFWGLPTNISFSLIFYNKDAFDTVSLDYPQAGWSWDDLLSAAKATTVQEGDQVVQWGIVQSARNPIEFVVPRSGPIIDTTTNPPAPKFDQPEVMDALQWYVDLYLLHNVAPNLKSSDAFSIPSEFELIDGGKAAMWSETSGWWPYRSNQMNVGVVPFPVDSPGDHTTQIYVNGYVVSAGTNHPQAAWRWLNFLSQQLPVTGIPANRSVAEADGFWDRIDPELGNVLQYALDHSYFNRFVPGYRAIFDATNNVLFEGQPVAEAMAEAQLQAETEIADFLAEEEGTEAVEIVISTPEETAVQERAVTIEFMISTDPNDLQSYRDLANKFQEQRPDILIEIKTPDFGNGLITLRDAATTSDCMQWSGNATGKMERAAILSIEPFLDADLELDKDDFYTSAIEQFSYQGQLWGLPAEMNIPVIFYNKELFDIAGVPYPKANWTTDDFRETTIMLTFGDDSATKQYGYVPQEFEINDLVIFLNRLGAHFLDESIDPPRLTFTHPDTVEAMRWFTSLTSELNIKPIFITSIDNTGIGIGEERKTLIENGHAAMWSDQGFQNYPEISLEELNLGIVSLPVKPDGMAVASSQATGYFISSNTTQRQACWEWVKFLSGQPKIGNYGNTIPSRRSIAESAAYIQAVGTEQAAANLASIEGITDSSTLPHLNSRANWLKTGFFWWQSYAYNQIIMVDVSVEEALVNVQTKADDYRDCIIARDALEDQNAQRTCLDEVDDTVPAFLIETADEK